MKVAELMKKLQKMNPEDEVTKETLSYWGLGDIKLEENEKYIVQLDDENAEVEEVYNTIGYNGKYSLTDIENIEI